MFSLTHDCVNNLRADSVMDREFKDQGTGSLFWRSARRRLRAFCRFPQKIDGMSCTQVPHRPAQFNPNPKWTILINMIYYVIKWEPLHPFCFYMKHSTVCGKTINLICIRQIRSHIPHYFKAVQVRVRAPTKFINYKLLLIKFWPKWTIYRFYHASMSDLWF